MLCPQRIPLNNLEAVLLGHFGGCCMLFQGMYYHHVCLQYACAAVFVREQETPVWEIGCSEKLAETLHWGVLWKPQEVDTSPKHPQNRPRLALKTRLHQTNGPTTSTYICGPENLLKIE